MQEKLSAMVDGEWDDHELEKLIASIDQDESCAQAWHDYHLISDAMRQQPVVSDCFLAKFSARLEAEPVVLAPSALRRRPAAPRKQWVALSMAASVALVSATAWYVGRAQGGSLPAAELQVAANQPAPRAAQNVDALNPYLQAHQAMVGNPGFSHRPVILTGAEAERAVAPR
ncbi:sigma-E factor negative regulatory protein [Chitinimonas taiwanensis]|jgi:sigma-E factor negative regulatory protein RseA|uniref:Sigma-E factor negative regulatory protein RseA n=1 Tax=Chitinimonas taiwanensis DSM 18899 TaxID=1121279 RepID=A0A1K2H7F4_9NEIS|nr:sigma-E factor negative regulatory protein [Chitinimonas taiwanensis]SFZ72521.1 sigma-E factor negative regulatory protein RseA [Chitinimonas taiwanensis DSM 18899]